jgi:polar amino acid transport system substrate-binding protein
VLSDSSNTIFIATRHDTHASFVVASLEAGKHVFVEKPLALDEKELEQIEEVVERRPELRLMVGYNRRFSPLVREARKVFQSVSAPLVINYRVNAGLIPKDHWIQTEQGGGRILGEVCHFVDLLQYLTNSAPVSVYAVPVSAGNDQIPDQDNVIVSLRFRDGSVGEITYLACGDYSMGKERIEIFGGGQSFIIDDFRSGEHYARGSRRVFKTPGKGHQEEVAAFISSIREGQQSPIAMDSLAATSRATFAVLDSLCTGLPQIVAPTTQY